MSLEVSSTPSTSAQKGRRSVKRLIFPVFIFILLLAVNAYFWSDYFMRKDKAAHVQKETRTLISGTVEDQKMSLEENIQKLKKFEVENSSLTGELASTTAKLTQVEAELAKYETDAVSVVSTTAFLLEKSASLSVDLAPLKKALLPL